MTRFIEFTGGDVEAYLHAQEQKDLLRFITCGSVDDGKSTLIGRLLVDSKAVLQDHLAGVQRSGETDLAHSVPCGEHRCLPLPADMTDVEAAAFQIAYGTAHLALAHQRIKDCQRLDLDCCHIPTMEIEEIKTLQAQALQTRLNR